MDKEIRQMINASKGNNMFTWITCTNIKQLIKTDENVIISLKFIQKYEVYEVEINRMYNLFMK